jgi:hypothetical protein
MTMNEKILKKLHLRRVYMIYKNVRRYLLGNSLLRRGVAQEVIDYYDGDGGHQINTKTGSLGYGFIHYALIRNLQPSRVLCIGSRKGFVPAICALACRDNGRGKVDFIDAGYNKENPKSWSGVGFWKDINIKKHFSFLNLSSWIDFHLMTSVEYSKKFSKRQFDYIYIDGDHSYQGVKNDYLLFWPKLVDGGFMVFHDATVKNWGMLKNFGVWKLLDEIGNQKKIVLPLRQSGLAIIQK